jgi:glutathione peroxidase
MAEPNRRAFLLGIAAIGTAAAAPPPVAWDFRFTSIEDGTLNLADFRGRVLLVTNTASFCGYTYQYKALEALHASLSPRGLTVVGVPSQDFGKESDSNGKVKAFCDATFGVAFPMAGLTHVVGPQAHPFYAWVRQTRGWAPGWNFNKVLIGRDGAIAGLFGAKDEPDGPKLRGAIEEALSAGA